MTENIPQEEPVAVETAVADPAPETVESLRARLEEETGALKDQLLRAMAETENTRKRLERDMADTAKYAIAGFARDLVNGVENLQRALGSIPAEAREQETLLKTLGDGVEMTLRELLAALGKHGVVRLEPKGEKFDHNFHQAVAQVETDIQPAGTVVDVLQAGYVIHDRLLRPAMVSVAKASANQAANG